MAHPEGFEPPDRTAPYDAARSNTELRVQSKVSRDFVTLTFARRPDADCGYRSVFFSDPHARQASRNRLFLRRPERVKIRTGEHDFDGVGVVFLDRFGALKLRNSVGIHESVAALRSDLAGGELKVRATERVQTKWVGSNLRHDANMSLRIQRVKATPKKDQESFPAHS